MKSSGPVFTRQNAFQPASKVGKTYYHPSSKQPLSQNKKKNTSPVRINQRSSPQLHIQRSPEEQVLFMKPDHSFAATDAHPVFKESWPSSECGSSPASTSTLSDMVTPGQSVRAQKHTASSEPGGQQDSVLSKYIERFRHGRPQSREERHQMASTVEDEPMPFWWMSSSALPPSSTPIKTTVKDTHGPATSSPVQSRRDRSLSPCRRSQSEFILSDTSSGEFDDTEMLQLQEKANRLLLRDDYTMNDGSIHVSPEGLGCSDFSSPLSIDEPVRRPLIPDVTTSANAKAFSDSIQALTSQKSSVIPSLVPRTHPEEDILFQWRLRRKIEQARESSQQHSGLHSAKLSWQSPSLSQTSARGKADKGSTQPLDVLEKATHPQIAAPRLDTKEAPGSCTPSSAPAPLPAFVVSGFPASQPQTPGHVPAHMHFLCDILPCPIQASHLSTEQNILQRMDETPTNVVRKKAHVTGNLIKTATPVCEHISVQPQAPSASIERERPCQQRSTERNKKEKSQTKELEKHKKKASISYREQKRSTRSSSQQRVSKKALPLAEEQQQQEGLREFAVDQAPPPSPIHSALGQVVSEVLFPTKDSSPEQRTPVSSDSPHTFSAPPQSSVHPCDNQASVEVISQLLQEAEDSDETEFEDDALLKVLRKQRKWVKEQIREVDTTMNDVLDKQQNT
ncbi:proline and serine-rich protein 3 isoform X2 [Notolabrus celidotus]|uniref:proline and serine-rich protein 3 isoform X2 n=1 Tax=Notolabrus celidotus TaxID=1203425 RepID=UPI00149059E9|nr:proline and serine-rich protein 3 isoform X2 [Notolabrus celidotus]